MGRTFWLTALLMPFAVPLLTFLVAGVTEGMSPAAALGSLAEQCTGGKPNPLLGGTLGLAPVGVIAIVLLGLRRRVAPDDPRLGAVGWGALLAAALVIAWANWEYWPRYLPEKTFMMFPHGMELVIGPLFFAPVGAVVGALLGWLTGRRAA